MASCPGSAARSLSRPGERVGGFTSPTIKTPRGYGRLAPELSAAFGTTGQVGQPFVVVATGAQHPGGLDQQQPDRRVERRRVEDELRVGDMQDRVALDRVEVVDEPDAAEPAHHGNLRQISPPPLAAYPTEVPDETRATVGHIDRALVRQGAVAADGVNRHPAYGG